MTLLPPVHVVAAIVLTSLFFVATSGRGIPANAMIIGTVKPAERGGFLNVNAWVVQLSAGLGSLLHMLYDRSPRWQHPGFLDCGLYRYGCQRDCHSHRAYVEGGVLSFAALR